MLISMIFYINRSTFATSNKQISNKVITGRKPNDRVLISKKQELKLIIPKFKIVENKRIRNRTGAG
jgi:hypothetical protein